MNYTTIEQSKKLVELGLDTNTADMWWQEGRVGPEPVIGNYALHIQCMKDCDYRKIHKTLISPAWSFGALWKVILINCDGMVDLIASPDKRCWISSDYPRYDTEYYNDALDVCYEMVCWLLENDYIK